MAKLLMHWSFCCPVVKHNFLLLNSVSFISFSVSFCFVCSICPSLPCRCLWARSLHIEIGCVSRECAGRLMGEPAQETSRAWLDDVKLGSRLKTSIRLGSNCSGNPQSACRTALSLPDQWQGPSPSTGFICREAMTCGFTFLAIISKKCPPSPPPTYSWLGFQAIWGGIFRS